jgi:hypothetical protein
MSRIFIIVIIIGFAGLGTHAQNKGQAVKTAASCTCGFQSLLQGGLLDGAAGPSWQLQTINGIYYKTWFAGIGVGLDYYTMRTIPLFLDLRKDIFRKGRTPFLYADGGIHFDWLRSKEKRAWGSGEYNRGLYYDLGGGYKFGFGSRDALLVSVGYTLKTLREERLVIQQCFQAPCNPETDHYNYTFGRLFFKVGWQFR